MVENVEVLAERRAKKRELIMKMSEDQKIEEEVEHTAQEDSNHASIIVAKTPVGETVKAQPATVSVQKVSQKKKSNEKKKETAAKQVPQEEVKRVKEVKKSSIEENIDDSWNLVASKGKKNWIIWIFLVKSI